MCIHNKCCLMLIKKKKKVLFNVRLSVYILPNKDINPGETPFRCWGDLESAVVVSSSCD